MNSTKKQARVAGLLYLLASIPGVFCLIYVPSHFIVSGDAAATTSKIAASEFVFRFGIVCEVAGFTGFIFVVRALYRLLSGVNKSHASLMVTLMLVSIPISLVNVLNGIRCPHARPWYGFPVGLRQTSAGGTCDAVPQFAFP